MATKDTTMFGTSFTKPSDVFGSMKRSLGRRPKCQCKHHQQKLLQKQEEQRQQLQAKLAQRGDKRAFNASFSKTLQELGNASELVILWITFNSYCKTILCYEKKPYTIQSH